MEFDKTHISERKSEENCYHIFKNRRENDEKKIKSTDKL